jgi:hypothetical protein
MYPGRFQAETPLSCCSNFQSQLCLALGIIERPSAGNLAVKGEEGDQRADLGGMAPAPCTIPAVRLRGCL